MSEAQALQTFQGVGQASFGDRDAARSDQIPAFKGKEGQTDRITILDPNVLLTGRAHGHFSEDKNVKGLGYVLCKSTYKRQGEVVLPDTIAHCCRLLDEARQRCVTLVLKYSVDPRTGNPTKPVSFTPMAWVFPPNIFEQLFTFNEEFAERENADDPESKIKVGGLTRIDLLVKCEDEKFQRLQIAPSPKRVASHPEFVKQNAEFLRQWAEAMRPKLPRLIGRDVSDQELVTKLGGGAGAGMMPASQVPPMKAPDDINSLFD